MTPPHPERTLSRRGFVTSLTAGALVTGAIGVTGCTDGGAGRAAAPSPETTPGAQRASPVRETRRVIPGLGPRTMRSIGDDARQVFVVTAADGDANRATALLYERHPTRGWQRTAGPWSARNGYRGWTDDHRMGDLRTPIGVYRLTDAGGLLPDPGTELPYDQGRHFTPPDRLSHEGRSLRGAFDHVVAINYNRVAGRSPYDFTRPEGTAKGGGIWIHVDHSSATSGCIGISRPRMAELLRRLDPGDRPVIAMGPVASLAR
ncbi:L,D-transpeptidase family protein [Streptomyces sp. NPDC000594]|uniref:L,D-transpeptidase family protein n=1 Tax=Streptomyces sp. NPDC000594 TaxID=3154261 RepID=UPI0033188DF3